MPNWCENTLTVSGETKDLAKFKRRAKAKNTALSLNKLLPLPKKQEANWYNWHIENWGTKWDVEAELIAESNEYITYEFMSAWSPPVIWLETISEQYPALDFTIKYDEPSMGYMGLATASQGVLSDKTIDY